MANQVHHSANKQSSQASLEGWQTSEGLRALAPTRILHAAANKISRDTSSIEASWQVVHHPWSEMSPGEAYRQRSNAQNTPPLTNILHHKGQRCWRRIASRSPGSPAGQTLTTRQRELPPRLTAVLGWVRVIRLRLHLVGGRGFRHSTVPFPFTL